MKKINLLYSLMLIASIGVVSSCKDDDEKSRTEILTTRSWAVSKAEVEVNGVSVDVTADLIDDCEKDNTLTFASSGVYTEVVGTDTCDGDEENSTGTWAWSDGETKLSITEDGDTYALTSVTISESALRGQVGTIDYDTNGDGTDDTEVKLFFTLKSK